MKRLAWCSAGILVACGGPSEISSSGGPPGEVAVSVTPQSVYLPPSTAQRFTATVTGANDKSVAWSVAEGAGAGTIAPDGTYTSPPAPGTYHVIARANADRSKAASAEVSVALNPVASITMDPAAADLTPGGTLQLHAVVSGVPDKAVIWTVREGAAGGSVDQNGLYTAPVAEGLYHVVAASHSDPSKTATAAISVAARAVITVSIDPPSASLAPGASQRFSAQVTGTSDGSVAWSATAGTIDSAGVYTAPAADGTYQVTATSHADPSKSATAEVKVASVPVVIISVEPSTAEVQPGGTLQFVAKVTGAQNRSVTWSATGGSIDATGRYLAGRTDGTYAVTATSAADPSKTATAQVTVKTPTVVAVTLSPQTATLAPGESQQFTATVTGTPDLRVEWTTSNGAITQDGRYTAPSATGSALVTAKSLADPSKSATATVTIQTAQFNDMTDHGGAVFASSRTFAVWWGDQSVFGGDVKPQMEGFLRGVNGSGYLALADQYMRGDRTTATFAGSIVDTSPSRSGPSLYPDVACAALANARVQPRPGDLVMVYDSTPVEPDSAFCALHSSTTCDDVTVMIAYLPYPGALCGFYGRDIGCTTASLAARALASVTAHELMESITNPYGSGWVDRNGAEVADKCASLFGCYQLSTGPFQMQKAYSNATHSCGP